MFTPYGYSTMVKTIAICIILGAAALISPFLLQIVLLVLSFAGILFTLYFFRDPQRKAPDEKRVILAPADGKILLVEKQKESPTGHSPTLVSIFMSPFNVHVNRIPISGKVTLLHYHPGQFLMAFDNRSMESNERMEIGIDNGEILVQFSQVSGFLARRIVCTLRDGESVEAGKRFGMIKFGSRADIILPPSARVVVKPGETTRAGQTILARY